MSTLKAACSSPLLLFALALASSAALAANSPNLGKPVTENDIKAWDITILPDGTGLPPGSGTAAQGAKLFDDKGCSICHGKDARGGKSNELIGNPSLTEPGIDANKTIANFWGQASTLFDYIRRAMPWPTPHTLYRRRGLRAVRLSARRQQHHSARRADERADPAQGEDAEPRQLHHQVPGPDLARHRAALARTGTPIGAYDILIAAQARRRGATLVTANEQEFARVSGLQTENWTR